MLFRSQSAPSFEGRLFLNNPSASAETAQSLEQGYAGTIHVYSYGINPIYSAEQTTHGALLPMRREVVATEAILQAAKQGATASVTLVPVVPGAPAARQSAIPGEAVVESVSITAAQP